MVSTPIGAPNSPLKASYAPPSISKSSEIISSQSIVNQQTHSFPVLYTTSPIAGNLTTDSTVTPISLYSEYMGNPYIPNNTFNIYGTQPLLVYQQPNQEQINNELSFQNNETQISSNDVDNTNSQNISPEFQTVNNSENINESQSISVETNSYMSQSIPPPVPLPANIFQSSNYFYNTETSNIPLGSEILFGTSNKS